MSPKFLLMCPRNSYAEAAEKSAKDLHAELDAAKTVSAENGKILQGVIDVVKDSVKSYLEAAEFFLIQYPDCIKNCLCPK